MILVELKLVDSGYAGRGAPSLVKKMLQPLRTPPRDGGAIRRPEEA